VPLGLLLPLPALVAAVGLLDHAGRLVELALLPVGEGEPAEVGLATLAAGGAPGPAADGRAPDDLVGRAAAARGAEPAVELQLQLEEVAEVGGRGRRGGRVRGQAAAGRRGGTRLSVRVGDGGRAATALAVRVEELAGVEGLPTAMT
jgi:hypothetical protein